MYVLYRISQMFTTAAHNITRVRNMYSVLFVWLCFCQRLLVDSRNSLIRFRDSIRCPPATDVQRKGVFRPRSRKPPLIPVRWEDEERRTVLSPEIASSRYRFSQTRIRFNSEIARKRTKKDSPYTRTSRESGGN